MTSGPTDAANTQRQNKPPFVPPPAEEIAIEFKPGDIVGSNYEIICLLGQGGMGNIYRAKHNIMLEEYALKTLRTENLTDVSWKRFQKEAQAIGRMNHQNIVAIYNFGLHNKTVPYYVMAQLQGKTLHDIVQENGPMAWNEALPIFVEVCAGMGYAHKKGVIHRDLKPPNVVVLDKENTGSRVKIVDFGIVKFSDDSGNNNQQLTNIGEVCGSPYYMSPEQCEAGTVDARSDIYSLGCTLYEVLTGAPPFRGRNVVETMLKHQSAKPASLKEASGGKAFPPLLEQIVQRMLAKSPSQRHQTMEELAQELQAVIEGREPRPSSQPNMQQPQAQKPANAPQQSHAPQQTKSPHQPQGQPTFGQQHQHSPQHGASPAVSQRNHRNLDETLLEEDFRRKPAGDEDFKNDQAVTARAPSITRGRTTTAERDRQEREKASHADDDYERRSRNARRYTQGASQQDDDDTPEFQNSLPPYFVRLMIGTMAVTVLLLSALGFWWVNQKPPTTGHSPVIDAGPMATPTGMPGTDTSSAKPAD